MTNKDKPVKDLAAVADRRDFLRLAGAGVVGAGAVVAQAAPSTAATQVVEVADGYRETDHVRRYYELAR